MSIIKIISQIVMLAFIFVLASCIEGFSGRAGRPLIEDLSKIPPTIYCTGKSDDAIDCVENYCTGAADDPTDCINNFCTGITAQDNASCVENWCTGNEEQDNVKCVIKKVTRPTDALFIDRNYCSCKSGKPDIQNSCTYTCASEKANTAIATLYMTFSLGAEIELNELLGSTKNWCEVKINDGNKAPSCKLVFSDGINEIELTPTWTGANSITVNLFDDQIAYDKTYLAFLRESTSMASSDFVHVRRVKQDSSYTAFDDYGTIKIMPTSQYSCMRRSGSDSADGTEHYYNTAYAYHYYFPYNETPDSLPPGSTYVYCHDITLSPNDSPDLPRLELIPQAFSLWDKSDLRFYKSIDQQHLDINLIIQKKLESDYDVSFSSAGAVSIFGEFRWWNTPPEVVTQTSPNSGSSSSSTPLLGFFMKAWIDQSNYGRGFCPTQTHYNGSDPYFKVLKELVGVDTEGIYIGQREALPEYDSTGAIVYEDGVAQTAPADYLLIRESMLKKIWFYTISGKYYTPTDITAASNTIKFYWPPDVEYPYVKKSYQYVYTIKSPETLNMDESQTRIFPAPPDKRFGCVPKMNLSQ